MKPLLGLTTVAVAPPLLKQSQGVVTATVVPPIQTARWARNGKQPNALPESQKSESANHAAVYRTKEVFRSLGPALTAGPSGGGDAVQWRWVFHSGPFAHALYVCPVLGPGSTSSSLSSYARIDITAADGSSSVSETFYYGQSPYTAGVESFRAVPKIVSILPDTTYTAQLVQVDNGVLQSACVYELASLSENNAGYLPQNFAQGSPVYAENRQNLAELAAAVWKRGAAQVLNWVYPDWTSFAGQQHPRGWNVSPILYAGSTPANVLDTFSTPLGNVTGTTTIGPNTPGWMLDLTGKRRRAQTGVPVMMAAYGSLPSGTASVLLRDQTGATLLSVSGFTIGSSPAWYFATGILPDTVAKYDIHLVSDGTNLFNLYAVSLFEYES